MLGLIGNPVSHSKSPEIFQKFFQTNKLIDWDYKLFHLESISDFPRLLNEHPDLIGLNVTIPFKQAIIPFLHELTEEARFIGAVNTCLIIKNNNKITLQGCNTDAFGFEKALAKWETKLNTNALVLGTGGSSKAVQFVLKKLNIPFRLVSRNQNNSDFTYAEITNNIMRQFQLIIQTTPLGMLPNLNEAPPIPYQYLTPDHSCFDLVYNPIKTKFLALAEERGASIQNGSRMLQYQAEKAWELFQLNAKNS